MRHHLHWIKCALITAHTSVLSLAAVIVFTATDLRLSGLIGILILFGISWIMLTVTMCAMDAAADDSD